MHVTNTTIEFTQGEIETIGDALCATIKERLVGFADKDLDIDDYIQEERALLYDLTSAGYQLWVNAAADVDIAEGYLTIDVDKWIEVEKAKLLNEPAAKQKNAFDTLIKKTKKSKNKK